MANFRLFILIFASLMQSIIDQALDITRQKNINDRVFLKNRPQGLENQ